MKQIALLFLVLVAMMFAVYWLSLPQNSGSLDNLKVFTEGTSSSSESTSGSTKNIKVGKNTFKVEIADLEEERQIGLSNHTTLDRDSGMLFDFGEQNVRPSFWMKGMDFSIDIIWINDGKVTQINSDLPTVGPGVEENNIPRYVPNNPVDYVLEVAAGVAKEKNIKVGDTVEIPKL